MELLEFKPLASIAIFIISYMFIITEKINKTIVAILSASAVLFLKLISFKDAVSYVDFNVIFLLVGMMISVYILSKTGFFEWIAISLAKYAKGNPVVIMLLLLFVTAFLSAFLDNVTTIILLVPVTILIMQLLEIDPVPFLILEVIASNIGGTSTLIGDPPNIIIGSQVGISFNSFIMHLGPVILINIIVFMFTVFILFKKKLAVHKDIKYRVCNAIPKLAIVDKKNMIKSLIVLGFIFIGFFLHDRIGIEPGIIALCGSMIMLLWCNIDSEESLMKVEWGVVFFFIGMFMMIASLEHNGVIKWAAGHLIAFSNGNVFFLCIIILWGSALFSSLLDNIPFVITMIPLVKQFVTHIINDPAIIASGTNLQEIAMPIWWSLALGACLGGNGTIIGASANIIMVQISAKNKYPISFLKFSKYGFSFMIQSMIISTLYIWLRYF